MPSKQYTYYLSYLVILIGIFISGYLLFSHYALYAGKPLETDLCSVIFKKGCDASAYSSVSQFLKIPVGGWGIIYLAIIGCYLLMSQFLYDNNKNEIIQLAFWISLSGVFLSLFFIVIIILNPIFFCPFCAVFHFLNFILFFLIKKLTGKSFLELTKGFVNALGMVFLGKKTHNFSNWKWLTVFFPLLLGLSIYQWSLMQGLNITNEKLASYDPLIELEKFEARKIWDIPFSKDDPILGPIDAPVTLVVFSDFQCDLCEMFSTNFKHLVEYNKGQLNIVFKYFPLSSACNPIVTDDMHPLACNAARAAEAAHQQDKFWEYHDSMFQLGINDNPEVFFEIAQSIGLNLDSFKSDYESKICQEKISLDVMEGLGLEIDGTPTAFLNGRKIRVLSKNNINFLVKFLAH